LRREKAQNGIIAAIHGDCGFESQTIGFLTADFADWRGWFDRFGNNPRESAKSAVEKPEGPGSRERIAVLESLAKQNAPGGRVPPRPPVSAL